MITGTFLVGAAVFILGSITTYAAYRLKWISFELYAYSTLAVFFLSLFIFNVVGSQDWIWNLLQLAIPWALLAVLAHAALQERQKHEKK